MKNYTTIPHTLLNTPMGCEITSMGTAAIAVMYYLRTKSLNVLGIYEVLDSSIAHYTGISTAKAKKIIDTFIEIGFCKYDKVSKYIWICDHATMQLGRTLSKNDNQVKYINEIYHLLPETSFLKDFYDKYAKVLCITASRENYIKLDKKPCTSVDAKVVADDSTIFDGGVNSVSGNEIIAVVAHDKAPSKGVLGVSLAEDSCNNTNNNPVTSTNCTDSINDSCTSSLILTTTSTSEQIIGNDKGLGRLLEASTKPNTKTTTKAITNTKTIVNKKTKAKKDFCLVAKNLRPNPSPPTTFSNSILEIFTYWQKRMNHPKAKLDAKRKRYIKQSLKLGYSKDDLLKAIDGCAKSPFNMGKNDRGEIYDDLNLILRDAAHIDRFMKMFVSPPKESRKNETVYEHNLRQTKESTERLKAQMLPDGTFDLCAFLEKEVARA
ncbi:MAG: hypothetical protein COC15_01575 [Legionellales bacterium]|nr:MAG: hypothetical protein COC15_01575 [Legionellales bacterium]